MQNKIAVRPGGVEPRLVRRALAPIVPLRMFVADAYFTLCWWQKHRVYLIRLSYQSRVCDKRTGRVNRPSPAVACSVSARYSLAYL